MSRYSSDSDSSGYHRKSRRKRRSSSSSSSDSNRCRRSKSSKHRSSSRYKKSGKSYSSRSYRRSRSRSKNGSRRSRSTSKDRRRRSRSKDKYRSKHHYKSGSHSRGHSSKYHSRSSSSDSKNSSSSSSTSKSSSNNSHKKNSSSNSTLNPDEQLREKLLRAIKAAESADHQLKQQGVLPKGVKSRNDISNLTTAKPQSDVLRDINSDEFVQQTFTSSKQKKENSVDELNIPSAVENSNAIQVDENSIFHASFFVDPKVKLDRWVRKLYQIRQRAISGEPLQS